MFSRKRNMNKNDISALKNIAKNYFIKATTKFIRKYSLSTEIDKLIYIETIY